MKSTDVIQPSILTQPVAVSGTRNEIPEEATGTNKASIAEGFPDITMIAPADGGLPPYGQDFNGLFYSSTDQKVFLQNGGLITFNQDVSDAIGGYPKGAYLDYVSNGTYNKVESLIDDNTYNFIEDSSYLDNEHWKLLSIEGTFANSDLSNLSDVGENKLEAQKGYYTGNVLTDSTEYAQLVNMASSTFDSSKLTIVGSPTITEDGIASGFSSSSYITLDVPEISTTESFLFRCKVYCVNNEVNDRFQALLCGVETTNAANFALNRYGTNIVIYFKDEEGNILYSNSATAASTAAFSSDTEHELIVDYKDETLNVYVDDTLLNTSEVDLSNTYWGEAFQIGFSTETLYLQYGTIDLKSLELKINGTSYVSYNQTGTDTVTIDGEEVEIPYTLSSTGSKIVDVAYRETVQALYEQDGKALYYTLDTNNQNFTLPMGEIYGMLQSNTDTLQTNIDNTAETLQTNIDTLQSTVETDYLPLSGGTMTGVLKTDVQEAGFNAIQFVNGNFSVSKTTAPSSTTYNGKIVFWGSDATYGLAPGIVENFLDANNNVATSVHAARSIDGTNYSSYVRAVVNSSGVAYGSCPTYTTYTDSSTKICTTAFLKTVLSGSGYGMATYSKGTNGYIKFANGIIIQWGTVSASSGAAYTVTFPCAFSSATSYAITKNHGFYGTSQAEDREVSFYTRTSTTATTYNTESSTVSEQWIAIGY